jgi:hypothetical protein
MPLNVYEAKAQLTSLLVAREAPANDWREWLAGVAA